MYKRWFCAMIVLCGAAIALSCVWLITPQSLAANYPLATTQNGTYYELVDMGGYVTVLHFDSGTQTQQTQTDILVNLLAEQDALRIKQGYRITSEATLYTALETLNAGGTLS